MHIEMILYQHNYCKLFTVIDYGSAGSGQSRSDFIDRHKFTQTSVTSWERGEYSQSSTHSVGTSYRMYEQQLSLSCYVRITQQLRTWMTSVP